MSPPLLPLALAACGFAGAEDGTAPEPLLTPGDRVAFVGGTFWEDERRDGGIETALTLAVPGVTFRHLGWGGDMADQSARRFFGDAGDGREHLLEHLDLVEPTVVLVAYGSAESLPGGMPVDDFRTHLGSLLDESEARADRVVLVPPGGERAAAYAAAVRDLAAARGLRVAGLDELTPPEPRPGRASALGDLTALIREKNDLFLHRHRPQNETYLRGFRAHEQGTNAAEIARFEPLVAAKDAAIQVLRTEILQETE